MYNNIILYDLQLNPKLIKSPNVKSNGPNCIDETRVNLLGGLSAILVNLGGSKLYFSLSKYK